MNQEQRKALQEMGKNLAEMLDVSDEIVGGLGDQERDKFDNLNEGLQQSEMGEALENSAELLDELGDIIQRAGVEIQAAIEECVS